MPRSGKLALGPIGLLILFLALGFTFTVTFPFTTGPDEVAHFQFTRFTARYGRLPMTPAEQKEAGYKSDLPPLFHLLVGLTGQGIDLDSPPFVKLTHKNPRLQLVVGLENVLGWRAITTEDPYQGEVLLWYWGRWLALLSGLLGIIATYVLIRANYPDYPWLALAAASLLAFIPPYIHVSSVISYEPLLGALITIYFVHLFYTLQDPRQNWRYLALGLLLGLAGLTKYTPLPALPVLVLLVVGLAYRQKWPRRTIWGRLSRVGLGLALPLGSWLVFKEIYFNQVARLGWFEGLLAPFLASDGSDETSLRIMGFLSQGSLGVTGSNYKNDSFFEWAWRFFDGVWGGGWLTWLFLGLWLIALAGLVSRWLPLEKFAANVSLKAEPAIQIKGVWPVLLAAHIGLFMFLPLVRFLITKDAVTGMGQHLLFPAGAAMLLLLIWGLSSWLAPRSLTMLLFAVAGLCLWQSTLPVIKEYTPAMPIQTVPLADEVTLATFETVSLIGYEYVPTPQTLSVTLRWRTEAFASEDYRLELTLLNANHQPQARWLGQPLNGRFPTRAWQPGDRVADVIQLPVAGLSPGDYRVRLRWLNEAGQAIPVTKFEAAQRIGQTSRRQAPAADQALELAAVSLMPSPPVEAETVILNGRPIGYTLWPANFPAGNPTFYQENATIIFSTNNSLADNIHLSLVGPDEQAYAPLDHTGTVYNFVVEPFYAKGDYRFRFEQWAEAGLLKRVDTAPLLHIETQERQFQIGPISNPVEANFAGQIALLGYELPERRAHAGANLPVTLHWQALKTVGADLIMFNHLVDHNGQIWGGQDRQAREAYSTMLWAPGEIVSDSFNVHVKTDAPDGIYTLLIGLYLPVGQAPVSLPLIHDGQMTDSTHVNLGPVKVGGPPPDLVVETATPQNLLNQPLGETPQLTLLGYDLDESLIDHYQLGLTLYWRAEGPLPLDYTTFVHVRNAAGETVAQKDQQPLQGTYPTSLWDPGEILADEIAVSLPADLPAGAYQLVIGLYDFYTGQRLIVPDSPANEVSLTHAQIP